MINSDSLESRIVRTFLSGYDLNTTNFDNNIKSLVFDSNIASVPKYNPIKNSISCKCEGKRLCRELIHMASNINDGNVSHGAVMDNMVGISLDEGIAEYSMSLMDAEYKSFRPFELLFVNLITDIYGDEDLLERYYDGRTDVFYDTFRQDKHYMLDLVSKLDKYTKAYELLVDASLSKDLSVKKKLIQEYDLIQDEAYYNLGYVISSLINKLSNYEMFSARSYASIFNETVSDMYFNKPNIEERIINSFNENIKFGEMKLRNVK